MNLIDGLRAVIGSAPPGLEFLEYTFLIILVVIGLFLVCDLIRRFFDIFVR